nr:hypothetical protein [Mycobacterium eburneum]
MDERFAHIDEKFAAVDSGFVEMRAKFDMTGRGPATHRGADSTRHRRAARQ